MDKYTFEVKRHQVPALNKNEWEDGFYYVLFKDDKELVESNEYFGTEFRARMAALGHITLIENGKL
jgi:hypothetical protein